MKVCVQQQQQCIYVRVRLVQVVENYFGSLSKVTICVDSGPTCPFHTYQLYVRQVLHAKTRTSKLHKTNSVTLKIIQSKER